MRTTVLDKIRDDLTFLKRSISEIREHMVDRDSLLTSDEALELDRSIARSNLGKTKGGDSSFSDQRSALYARVSAYTKNR